jgi:hypothetical protein
MRFKNQPGETPARSKSPQESGLLRGEKNHATHYSLPADAHTPNPESASVEKPHQDANTVSVWQRRTLQIETVGDFAARKIKPLIRLTGRWLEKAGFKPGDRVEVSQTKAGELVLQAQATATERENPAQAGSPLA